MARVQLFLFSIIPILEKISYKCKFLLKQEVETEQFDKFFLPELKRDGYSGIFSPKSRAKTMNESDKRRVDGCAIFFKHNKYVMAKPVGGMKVKGLCYRTNAFSISCLKFMFHLLQTKQVCGERIGIHR